MIQLGLSRASMLADIGAGDGAPGTRLLDPDDPSFADVEAAHFVVRAHHRNELFARLEPVLRRRFGHVAGAHLDRDLLAPLHKAIGNSHRRGNLEDPAKWLTVEVVLTRLGAVLALTDEGSGFDVERVVRQFEDGERYFTRDGNGIECFAETRSLVSYADGGRTWLLRFFGDPEPGEPLGEDDVAALGPVGDEAFLRGFLASQVPSFRDHGIAVDSCRVFSLSREPERSELAYVLRCRSGDQAPETTVLTARLLSAAAAEVDVAMATELRDAGVGASQGLAIARPLGAFAEPPLSLFDLDPSVTLRERAREMTALGPIALVLRVIAIGLAAIHLSTARPEAEESLGDVLERHRKAKPRVEARFTDPRSQQRVSDCYDRLQAQSGGLEPCAPVPIHGALEWDCIVDSGRRWTLYRFDQSRLAHPGIDVGAFLADLLRFHALHPKRDPGPWVAGRATFLQSYFSGAPPPWARDMDWFVASALLERLDRLTRRKPEKWAPKAGPLLDEIERCLARRSDPGA